MNYNKQVRRVLRFGHFNHRGVIVSITENGYKVFGQFAETKEQVDAIIDEHLQKLNSSLNRIKSKTNDKEKDNSKKIS